MVDEAHNYKNLSMCQFLIGKVKLGDDEITAVAVLCQFLIGKVKHYFSNENGYASTRLCQFLIGKVKQLYFQSL